MGRLLLERPRLEGLEPRLLLHDNPTMDREHAAVFALVPDLAVTHFAIQDGGWSDPMTWSNGAVPVAEANVLVPSGLTVTVDGKFADALRTARVDGTLRFATDVDTTLTVDTLIVSPSGTLEIGTSAQPVSPGVVARVVFADRGPIDTAWDPNLFSRGLISHGTTMVFGSARTGHVALSAPAARGATTLTLAQPPAGWRPGDELVLAGVSTSRNEDEKLKVISVKGAAVTVDKPLAYAHASPRPEYGVYVANLTRNVVFESQNRTPGETARRGHVMLLHSPHVDVNDAAFVSLGRTDKKARINDAQLDAAGALVPGTGTNVRGRYALHLHRSGIDATDEPALVRGCAAVDGVGWGFVNHSSYANIEDSVTYDVVGAGFVTEAGDEIGAFRRNFALRSAGSGAGIESRQDVQDFGHEGIGFWFQGPGVEVTDKSRRASGAALSSISPAASSRRASAPPASVRSTSPTPPSPTASPRWPSATYRSGCSATTTPSRRATASNRGSTCSTRPTRPAAWSRGCASGRAETDGRSSLLTRGTRRCLTCGRWATSPTPPAPGSRATTSPAGSSTRTRWWRASTSASARPSAGPTSSAAGR